MASKLKMDLCLPTAHYREILKKLDFAEPFLDDPDIFNSSSDKSRNFIMQAFAYIHPDFHYLSFLNKEINQEIIKAAEILQILPLKTKTNDNLFDNLNESEIKKFWSRLFALLDCKNMKECYSDTNIIQEQKFDFLKDISKTLDYVHFKMPVVKERNLSNDMLNNEIDTWNNVNAKSFQTQEDLSYLNYDVHQMEQINIEKLLINLKQMSSILKHTQFATNDEKPEHLEFFSSFISLTQNIHQYVTNFKEINSSFLSELHAKMLSQAKLAHSRDLCFLKKCSNFLKMLKYKNKFS